jgi:HEAT repeat protein
MKNISLFITILLTVILIPFTARAIDQSTIDNLIFLLDQPEWNQWGDGVFDDVTLYDGFQAIYARSVNENDEILMRKVLWAMGETGLPFFAPTLIGAIPDEPISACMALGKMPSVDGVDALIVMLDNDDPQVRDAVAWALGNMPYDSSMSDARDRAVSALNSRLLKETEDWVKKTISGAVVYIQTGVATDPAFDTSQNE